MVRWSERQRNFSAIAPITLPSIAHSSWDLKRPSNAGPSVISIYLDSELLVRQVQGIYRVKNPDLKPLMMEIRDLLDRFDAWKIEHVRRSENALADGLANEAIDETLKKQ